MWNEKNFSGKTYHNKLVGFESVTFTITKSFSSFLFILLLLTITFGQQNANNTDQALRGSSRVNPSTLGIEFDLSLGGYSGRGINIPISINYSSKLWRMKSLGSIDSGIVTGGCCLLSEAKYSENSDSGWTTGLAMPYIEYTDKDNLYNSRGFPLDNGSCVNAPPNNDNYASYIRRISVHLPSGETHELRADDTPVLYSRSSTYLPANGYGCDPNSYWLQANWDRTFLRGGRLEY